MFGFGFEGKVKDVLKQQFDYMPGAFQGPTLSEIVREAKAQGVNEYDAAIMFMMVQMNALVGGGSDVEDFVRKHTANVRRVMPFAKCVASDITAMLDEIGAKHGLEPITPSASPGEAQSFDDWLRRFKLECGKVKSGLAGGEDGKSLIDFMDHEPLRRAHRDGESPEVIGRAFAQQFDINTFGKR